MKLFRRRAIAHLVPFSAFCAAVLFAAPSAFAAKKVPAVLTYPASFNATYYYNGGNNQFGLEEVFDGTFSTHYRPTSAGSYIEVCFTNKITSGNAVYVSTITIDRTGNTRYSLYVSEDNSNWNAIVKEASDVGRVAYQINARIRYVKYVFDTWANTDDELHGIEIKGYESTVPAKISDFTRSLFIRGGKVWVGCAGTNGGDYTDSYFDGNFTDYRYFNDAGSELVIPTTALDDLGNDTGAPQYVTEFKVGHKGNAKYSLYYTTDAAPDYSQYEKVGVRNYNHSRHPINYYYDGLSSDNRNWIAIDGAQQVQEAGTKTYLVNKNATAVKYVFNTCPSWTVHLAEVEVWAMDPDDLPCMHENFDPIAATWTRCAPPTCTENAIEESFCPDCGERFEREESLSKLGHDFVATLTKPGRHDSWGGGYVTCARTILDTNTLEVVWSCDYRIDFTTNDVDLTTLGGPPINGVVQYTDLTVSSIGAQDGGIKAVYLMDGFWDSGWGHAFYFETRSVNEYLQYAFGTTIELTKIEFSVLNEYQTVYFSKYDPDTGVETPLKTIPIEKITNYEEREDPETGDITQVAVTPGYQRFTVDFFVSNKDKKTFVDAIRMRVGDYLNPETGEFHTYPGLHYGGSDIHTIVCEIHPWGTIQWAGPLTHDPTTIMVLR